MKKWLSLLLIIALTVPMTLAYAETPFDVIVPEFTAMKTDTADATVYNGYDKGLELIINASYMDTDDSPYEESIIRMTTLGVAKQYGDKRFNPGLKVTGYEALGMLVRMMGNENAVMTRVYAQTGSSMNTTQVGQLMNKEYLAEATTLGIITPDEVPGLNDPITKERVAVWTARALGTAPVYSQETVFSFNDWQQVNPNYRALIETMVTDGIIPLKNDGSFSPKDPVARDEMASITQTAIETMYADRNIQGGFGLVIGVKPETIYEDGDTIKRQTVTVKNTDGTVSQLVSEDHTKGNRSIDYVVYKNSYVSNHQALKIGDEVEYLVQDDAVKYVDVVNHDLILEKINADTLADENSTFHYGTVSEIRSQTINNLNQSIQRKIFRIVDVTGDTFDILVDEDIYSGQKDDIITYKGEGVGGTDLLKQGDVLEYLVNANKEVVYIKVEPIDTKTISGTVREVTPMTDTLPATMTIYGYDDKVYEYPIAPYANLMINDRYTTLDQYVYGMNVTVNISNGYILLANGESYSGEPGYIPKYGKMRMGTITSLYPSSFIIKLSNDETLFVTTNGQTQYSKDGNQVTFGAMKVGNAVKVYYDDIYTSDASKIEIESQETLFEIIYKGRIENVNQSRKEVQLVGADGVSNPEYINNNDWLSAETRAVDLKVDERTEIYAGDQRLTLSELERYYPGSTAYAVVKSEYGKSKVVKLSVRVGAERIYNTHIRNVDYTLNQFEIATKENFNLTSGSIVIKDGMVVSNNNIGSGDAALVVSEYAGYYENAMVVKLVTPYEDIFDSIRIGAIENTYPNAMTLRDYTSYNNNFLNDVDENSSGRYNLFSTSKIVDVTDSNNPVSLTPYEFFNGSYSRTENVDPNYSQYNRGLQYDRYYAFMVVNPADDGVLAMHVRQKGLLNGQNIDDNQYDEDDVSDVLEDTFKNAVLSRGIVVSDDKTWNRIEITDSHDWTDYTGRWTANMSNVYIEYTDAIVIKNNQIITPDDIKLGDYVYTMRINEDALVIMVED